MTVDSVRCLTDFVMLFSKHMIFVHDSFSFATLVHILSNKLVQAVHGVNRRNQEVTRIFFCDLIDEILNSESELAK